jgi:hypothetical protein
MLNDDLRPNEDQEQPLEQGAIDRWVDDGGLVPRDED